MNGELFAKPGPRSTPSLDGPITGQGRGIFNTVLVYLMASYRCPKGHLLHRTRLRTLKGSSLTADLVSCSALSVGQPGVNASSTENTEVLRLAPNVASPP